jgi:phage terminase large subunit-like protein
MKNAARRSGESLPEVRSTLTRQGTKSLGELLACVSEAEVAVFLGGLSKNALTALPWMFEFWALAHQIPPVGDWSTWVVMGGRGAGKTRAGAEWVRAQVEGSGPLDPGRCRCVALIGETIDQAREVMVFGDSGILACSPPDRVPQWQATRKQLVWPNGAVARIYSASDPGSLRGPQFDCAWIDELAKWKKARDAWDMLQFALRAGDQPQVVVTTTPQNVAVLREILQAPGTVVTSAPTSANAVNLARSFLEKVTADYAGSRLGRQELEGELLQDVAGALWRLATFDAGRIEQVPELDRVVVAIDPPVSSGDAADECGLIVAGVRMQGPPQDWRAYVLADLTLQGATPNGWAQAAVAAAARYQADRVVAEINQGGEMVESVLRQQSGLLPFRAVRASKGKTARAEPVAALYEQGRVAHVGSFRELEDQMCEMTQGGFRGKGSPDRVDALVWALTDLMIDPAANYARPRVRSL